MSYLVVKRWADLLAALLLGMPAMVIGIFVASAVRISMGSPVFFRQDRIGVNERRISVMKFRTMTEAPAPSGHRLPDEIRVTRLGRFLRASSLDELPQLLNIIAGEMSFVGPRPLLPEYLPYYSDQERRRHNLRPGITGLAQVSGRNLLTWDERLKLDLIYVQSVSFQTDLAIMGRTVVAALTRRGAVPVQSGLGNRLDHERRIKE